MPEKEELSAAQRSLKRRLWFWGAMRTLGLLLAFYLLSTGPVCTLVDKGQLPDRAYRVYTPISWAGQHDWARWLDVAVRYYICNVWHAKPLPTPP